MLSHCVLHAGGISVAPSEVHGLYSVLSPVLRKHQVTEQHFLSNFSREPLANMGSESVHDLSRHFRYAKLLRARALGFGPRVLDSMGFDLRASSSGVGLCGPHPPRRRGLRVAMPTSTVPGLALSWVVALVIATASQYALAEDTPDPKDVVYATGAVFETEADLAGKPRTSLFRNYLPPSVDLTERFPTPGRQGDQSSCVGWAVGYAARSYYNSPPRGGPRLKAEQIPSPAYIYDAIRDSDDSCDSGTQISDALDLLK